MSGLKQKLAAVRAPKRVSAAGVVVCAALMLVPGVGLGVLAKRLDTVELSGLAGRLDLGNFLSALAFWLLAALVIAVFSRTPLQAALNVFLFLAGMCAAYHIASRIFAGIDPARYMRIWYALTLVSPVLAALCWYAKGRGIVSIVLSALILAVFALACFSMGFVYFSFRGVLYTACFALAAAALYASPKQLAAAVPLGLALAFLLSPVTPFGL